MIDYEKQFGKPEYQIGTKAAALTNVFKIVYGWMTTGLALSGIVAWYTARSGFYQTILQGPGFLFCLIAELALVIILGLAINKLPVAICYLMFIGYAALNGLTLSIVFIAYQLAMVEKVFFITAGMFGGLALWGTLTKSNLTSIGAMCGMALWGLIVAGIVNLFMHSSGLDFICSFVGIIIFAGLTMYDAQKVKQMAAKAGTLDSATINKVGIMGALQLYLDFVNLFLYIIRFMSKKK